MLASMPPGANPHILERLSRHGSAHCRVQFVTPGGTREASFGAMWHLSTRIAGFIQKAFPSIQEILVEAAYEGLLQSLPAGFTCPERCSADRRF
jgi:hypothetical protein